MKTPFAFHRPRSPRPLAAAALVAAAALAATATAPAQAHGRGGGRGGVSIGIGVGGPVWGAWGGWGPGWGWWGPRVAVAVPFGVVVAPPVAAGTVWIDGAPYQRGDGATLSDGRGWRAAPEHAGAAPAPVFEPLAGQTAAQLEADRIDCNRRTATYREALADAVTFQRLSATCMADRGYAVR